MPSIHAYKDLVARALRPFAKVEPGEVVSTVLLTLNVFLLLTAYYLLKTAREPLILLHGGAEVKSYASAGQAVLLLGTVQLYGAIARRVDRMRLLATLFLFFAGNLLLFAVLTRSGVAIGVPFYLWVGVFNFTAVAQFWAFSADIFNAEQGKRLFAILGIGSSTGAVAGARIARSLVVFGPAVMMTIAAIVLVVCVALFAQVDRHAKLRRSRADALPVATLGVEGPFQLLMNDRYLMLIAGMTLILNFCNSNGEYILDRSLLGSLAGAEARGVSPAQFVATFKADYFAWVNVVGIGLQLFAVSRVLSRFGVRAALLVLPIVAFCAYGLVVVAPVLALIRLAKVAENSLDYSLQNTAGQALYLVASRPQKYIGKMLVDTFVVRMGDVASALVVLVGNYLGMQTASYALINLGLAGVWLVLVVAIGREHARREAHEPDELSHEIVRA